MTLEQLAELGRWLRGAGPDWAYLLTRLEQLYRVTRDGRGTADWSLEHAASIASYVGLGPAPLKVAGHRCPWCMADAQVPWATARTVATLPDRFVYTCSRCSKEWVQLNVSASRYT